MRQGLSTPAFESQPVIELQDILVWRILLIGHSRRRSGFSGPEPIAAEDIRFALDIYGVDTAEERLEIATIVMEVDAAWLAKATTPLQNPPQQPPTPLVSQEQSHP